MVRRLELFKEYFEDYFANYILIGGTAAQIVMEDAGDSFRATQDLDIVLLVEALNDEFILKFWDFIKSGQYVSRQKSTGKNQYYRFTKPENENYPKMIELFSRRPEIFKNISSQHLTPLPAGEDISSLSAIIMDDEYYKFIQKGQQRISGFSLIGAEYLIPMKARAWLDLNERFLNGEQINRKDIKKHKLDVFRLFRIIAPEEKIDTPEQVKKDIISFVDLMRKEKIDLKNVGYRSIDKDSLLNEILAFYM